MSKTLISVLILGVLVVGGYFAFTANNGGEVQNGNGENSSVPDGKKMAFSQFLKQGGSYKCDVSQSVSGVENTGTVYTSNEMIRGEFSTTVQGRTIDSTMVVRDGYAYSWGSALPGTGFKVKTAASVYDTTTAGGSGSYSFNAEQIGDYNCEPWVREESKFTLPADVKFTTVGSQ